MTLISPSILSADLSNLGKEVQALEKAGADMIHIDIMDGHFVPNLTFGPGIVKAIKKHTSLPLDVHLMIEKPENSIRSYYDAGANIITIHPETTQHLDRTITTIKDMKCKAGIALLPTTSINILDYILDKIDLVLVMSVNPGFGGQELIESQLEKIARLSRLIATKPITLAVDGGIDSTTAGLCIKQGANMLISGSYIFSGNYSQTISNLRNSSGHI
jgi:ribulose-phosphate 3-epimerase